MTNSLTDGGWPGRRLMTAMWLGVASLLIAPAIAMQFSDEVRWTAFDFIFAGVILIGGGLVVEVTRARMTNVAYRAGACVAVLATILLIWVTGAVGIIGSEDHFGNQLYLGVLAIAVVGSLLSQFRPGGMAWAMLAAALAQAGVAGLAFASGWGAVDASWPQDILGATLMFVTLWLSSAALFRTAASQARVAATHTE